jgi:hydrogenase maturation protease
MSLLLVLGLGNPILGDDGVGLVVAEAVRPRLSGLPGVEVDTDCLGGLHLMERMVGYTCAVLVDAMATGRQPAGTVARLSLDDVPTQHTACSHDVNLPTALRLGAIAGLNLPEHIAIIGVEAGQSFEFSESLSPAVETAVPFAVQAVLDAVAELSLAAVPRSAETP